MILGINHVALSVPDLDRAIEFYCGLLGFQPCMRLSWQAGTAESEAAAQITAVQGTAAEVVHLRGQNLLLEVFQFHAGGARPQDPQRPVVDHGITHLCFAVTDVDAEYARLSAAGMRFHSAPTVVGPGVRTVYGRDPFGNVLEFEEAEGRESAIQPPFGV